MTRYFLLAPKKWEFFYQDPAPFTGHFRNEFQMVFVVQKQDSRAELTFLDTQFESKIRSMNF